MCLSVTFIYSFTQCLLQPGGVDGLGPWVHFLVCVGSQAMTLGTLPHENGNVFCLLSFALPIVLTKTKFLYTPKLLALD